MLIEAKKGSALTLDLRTNAFRVLGLETNAPLSAAIARRDDLVALIGIDKVLPYPSDYAIFAPPERTLETVAAAVQRLEDPRTRLFDEVTWFHLWDPIDASASTALTEGNSPQARALWEGSVAQATDSVARQHYQHNLAVLHLCTAQIPAQTARSPRKVWDRVLTAWTSVLSSDTFWQQLVDQSPARHDARFQADTPTEVRRSVGLGLAHACSRRAAEAIMDGHIGEAWEWATALTGNRFPEEFAAPSLDQVLEAMAKLIRTHTEAVEAALRKATESRQEPQTGWWSPSLKASWLQELADKPPEGQPIESRLGLARSTFERFRTLNSTNSPALQTTADLLAEAYRGLGLHYNNLMKDSAKALEATETAFRLAASEGLRVRLQQDLRVYHWNIALAAFETAKAANDYGEALTAFSALELYIDPAKGREALEQFLGTLRGLRVMRGCKPIKRPPSLSTINGFGTRLYGRSDADSETGTYIATLYFTAIFIPVFPIARYRVQDMGDGSYRFFGKAPLTDRQKAWDLVASLMVVVGLVATVLQETPRPSSQPRVIPPGPSEHQPRPRSVPPPDSREVLGGEIDRRRPLLEAEKITLETERQNIEHRRLAVNNLSAEIEARYSSYPDGLPPEVYARYETEVAEYKQRVRSFNARVDAYKAHVAAHERAIAEFNALVNRYNASR